ncbi:MAG: hypothetical protein MJE77_38710 [Proteobacteria bacterium]|nr:hypothetical protein [Pseudomonadota bacterium]
MLTYVAKCALNEHDSLVINVAGVEYEFSGLLGLAPDWESRALTANEEMAISACLLAHVNHFGVSVPISLRMGVELPVGEEERSRFGHFEGAFYGNLFSDTAVKYACAGQAPPDFSVSYPNHDTTEGDRLLRRCTDLDGEAGADRASNTTLCEFIYVGLCSEVCASESEDGYTNCRTDDEQEPVYAHVMSAWQLNHDDPASVWPNLYHEVYGP